MKRFSVGLVVALALVAGPRSAEAQLSTHWGVGGQLLFPTGDFDKLVTTGWGLSGTGELQVLHFLSATGTISYNKFPGESTDDGDLPDYDIFGAALGGRLNLALLFLGLDVGYYSDVDEVSLVPNLGIKLLMFEVAARYKATDSNWLELRGTFTF